MILSQPHPLTTTSTLWPQLRRSPTPTAVMKPSSLQRRQASPPHPRNINKSPTMCVYIKLLTTFQIPTDQCRYR